MSTLREKRKKQTHHKCSKRKCSSSLFTTLITENNSMQYSRNFKARYIKDVPYQFEGDAPDAPIHFEICNVKICVFYRHYLEITFQKNMLKNS